MNRFLISRRRMAGISMVESLVALVVIGVGMLGIAGLYLSSIKAGRSANLRVQAVNLGADMADRIRANSNGHGAYASAQYGGAPAAQDCASVTCTPEQVAENDLSQWFTTISASLRNLGAAGAVRYFAPGGGPTHRYEVTVTWREAGDDYDSVYLLMVELPQ